jgi:hypothetical protein
MIIVILSIGCTGITPPKLDVLDLETHSTQGIPLKVKYVSIPGQTVPSSTSFSHGSVWSVSGQFSKTKTIRVDIATLDVSMIDRPFDTFDLMIGERSLWLSEPVSPLVGGGSLQRYDINTNQLLATVQDAGTPFALSADLIWAYHSGLGTISGINLQTNQIIWKVDAPKKTSSRHFAYADGSIWQFVHLEKLSSWKIAQQTAAPAVVRRVDPQSNQIIAEIPVGLSQSTAGIYFVAGDIWVLGDRHVQGGGFATRIDVKNNRVLATIDLSAPPYPPVAARALPQTPVYWNGGVWISTFYTERGRMPGLLKQIDLDINEVVDQFGISEEQLPKTGQPMLVVGDNALWAIGKEAVLKIEAFQ